ncbi:MAG: trehalose-phosphatase [Pseudomonadota bacterium]
MSDLPLRVPCQSAFFFDFDGTLVALAPRPELVEVSPEVRNLLGTLYARYDGAVAIVTGRPLQAVDEFLAPVQLATAAEHGSVRRDAAGSLNIDEGNAPAIEAAYGLLEALTEDNFGLLLERKSSSIALHYRQRPELKALCEEAVEDVVSRDPSLTVLPGKMVLELKPKGIDKGEAVRAFLKEAPFEGRMPIFMGDDVTDEHAFAVVNSLGGISVKIDEGDTLAQYRTDRKGLFEWLFRLVQDA